MTTPSDEQAAIKYAVERSCFAMEDDRFIDAFLAGIRYRDEHPRTPEPSGDDEHAADDFERCTQDACYCLDGEACPQHESRPSFIAGRQSLRAELDRISGHNIVTMDQTLGCDRCGHAEWMEDKLPDICPEHPAFASLKAQLARAEEALKSIVEQRSHEAGYAIDALTDIATLKGKAE